MDKTFGASVQHIRCVRSFVGVGRDRQRVLANPDVLQEPAVRAVVPAGLRADFRLFEFSPPVRAVGHYHRKPHERLGEVSSGFGHFRVRFFDAVRGAESAFQEFQQRRSAHTGQSLPKSKYTVL